MTDTTVLVTVFQVQYDLNDFIGDLKMQGTLAVTPTSDDWFDITQTMAMLLYPMMMAKQVLPI